MAILPHGAGMSPNNRHIPSVECFVLVDLLKSLLRLVLIARYRWHSITCRLLRQVISREETPTGIQSWMTNMRIAPGYLSFSNLKPNRGTIAITFRSIEHYRCDSIGKRDEGERGTDGVPVLKDEALCI